MSVLQKRLEAETAASDRKHDRVDRAWQTGRRKERSEEHLAPDVFRQAGLKT
jgi:hypothetical protein